MEVKNPYLSVEISESQFKKLKEQVRKELQYIGFENLQELHNPHISVAYVLGPADVSDLEAVAEQISEEDFIMRVNGIKAVQSNYYGGTIISLSLEHTEDLLDAQGVIEDVICDDEICLKEDFPGGFQAHISLFVVKNLDEETIKLLPRYLEIALSNITQNIHGEKFCMYNEQREKLIEKPFKKINQG